MDNAHAATARTARTPARTARTPARPARTLATWLPLSNAETARVPETRQEEERLQAGHPPNVHSSSNLVGCVGSRTPHTSAVTSGRRNACGPPSGGPHCVQSASTIFTHSNSAHWLKTDGRRLVVLKRATKSAPNPTTADSTASSTWVGRSGPPSILRRRRR